MRGIDDPSGGERADHPGRADLAEIGIDLDLGEHGPVRMHGIGRLRGRIGRAGSVTLDLRKPGAGEDVRVALAAALVVATEQAAVARDHAGIAGAEQRRAIVVGREIGKPRDRVGAGVVNRHAGGRGVGRAAGDAAIRQVRRAGPELDLVDVEPKPIRRDLRQRGPGALPHVVSPDLHDAAAVAAQHRLGLGLEHERGKRRRAHAPADEQAVIIAHLPGCERTALPAELPGALRVALAQRLGGERLAGDRLDLGIVLEPKGQADPCRRPAPFHRWRFRAQSSPSPLRVRA